MYLDRHWQFSPLGPEQDMLEKECRIWIEQVLLTFVSRPK